MNRTLSLMCMLILITFSLPLNAQNGKVTGCITDSDGLPVIGASILVKGTTNGIISDLDGNYILENVPMESTLIYSFVGYDTQNIVYKGQSTIDVQLKTSAIALDEVVAIGYEVKKKSVVTGAISSIDSDDLLQSKPANAVNALSGRVSGVNVVTNSGQPGTAPKLVIRGVGTNGNSNPLFVIDGLPMDDMNSVNPNDIESMEVLKDATSAAIYGARAANGVVLITTKKGKKGKTSLAYDGYYGFSTVAKKPTMLNDEQYIMLMKEFADNDDMPLAGGVPTAPTGYNTDWFNEILNNSLTRAAYYDGLESYPSKNLVMLLNPLSADLNCMRQTLLFGGLESIAHNANRKNADLKFFEFGNCYHFDAEKKNPEKVLAPYSEDYHLGLWVTGKMVSNSWAHADENTSVYELKAYVENIFKRLGLDLHSLVVGNLSDDIYSTALTVNTKGGKRLATFGVVTKKMLKAFDVDNEVYYADLNWKELMKAIRSVKVSYKEISKFPAVKRDLALLLDKKVQFAEIEKIAYETEKKLLKEVSLFDVYEGKNLEAGKKSYAVSFLLQDESQTLNDKMIDKIMSKLVKNLEDKLGAKLR